MEFTQPIPTKMYLSICGIFLISILFSCSDTKKNKVIMVAEYHKLNGQLLNYRDSIWIEKANGLQKVEISNEQNQDTMFVVINIDSLIYIGESKKILSHNMNEKKIVVSNINTSFFSPYLSKNSFLDTVKVFKINNKDLFVYRFLENILDEGDAKGYSYYLPNVGFIAFINLDAGYYSFVKVIKNSSSLDNQELKMLNNLMIKDSLFFNCKRFVPELPIEYK
jgi:hypothetical protein